LKFLISKSWRRFDALTEVVDYLERGASALLPPPTRRPKDQYLGLIVAMKQWTPTKGLSTSRAVYSPPQRFQRSRPPEVVQQITWQERHDFEVSKQERVSWPAVTVQHFEISGKEEWRRIDSALRTLEERLGAFPFDGPETPGLSITRPDYVPGTYLEHRRAHEIVGRNSYVRRLNLQLSWGVIQAIFREGQDADFDSAWDEAWDALSEVCRPECRVQGYEGNYLIAPERLSELLTGAVNEEG
jgi:hypothetical protein